MFLRVPKFSISISISTPSGVVLKNPNLEYLKDGDEIEMKIENLGTLKNTVRFV